MKTPLYPQNGPKEKAKIRVGVMLENLEGEAWVGRILKDIQESDFADVSALIVNWELSVPKYSWLQNVMTGRILKSTELFWWYCQLSEKFNPVDNSPFRSVDFRPLLPMAPVVGVTPIRNNYVHRFIQADIDAVRELNLDVILRFGFNVIRGDILEAASCGVWSYHHGDNRAYRGGPAMFWEMNNREAICGTILQRLSEDLDNGQILYRSYAQRRHSIWLNAVREKPYWKSTAFVERNLRTLHQDKDHWPTHDETSDGPKGELYKAPSNIDMLSFGTRSILRAVAGNIREATRTDQWFLAYRTNPDKFVSRTLETDSLDYQVIMPPRGCNFSDPFLFHHEGFDYCFFEETKPNDDKGIISCFRFGADGKPSNPKTVLNTDFHLSYPFIFQWKGEVFMMPEAGSTNGVQVFKAIQFPHRWEHYAEVISGYPAYDPTLFEHNGRWYLFINIDERGGGSDDELFLFIADTPLGPWQPHPKNPIKSDVRSARSAGGIFYHKGRIIRPAQDCSEVYGGAIQLNEITELTENDYKEHGVGRIEATWRPGLKGCHTINVTDKVEVVDARRAVWRRPFLK